jgi:aryl-alcohol dehydrogenase-like predicted oxidoreductase
MKPINRRVALRQFCIGATSLVAGSITCAIPATSKVEHLRDNMKAGLGRLPDEKMRTRIADEMGAY